MRRALLLLLVLGATAAAGCGLGAGDSQDGGATVTVTRDFGARELGTGSVDPIPGGETVMRMLQRDFDVETRYGGGFVQEINGIAGGRENGRPVDWFYYVNGILADDGAAAHKVAAGDRVWWDHHDWSATQDVRAVVGAFPEPFVSGVDGKRLPVRIDCADDAAKVCDEVADRLADEGVKSGRSARGGLRRRGRAADQGRAVGRAAPRRRGAPARGGPARLGRLREARAGRALDRAARPRGQDGADARAGRRAGRRHAARRRGARPGSSPAPTPPASPRPPRSCRRTRSPTTSRSRSRTAGRSGSRSSRRSEDAVTYLRRASPLHAARARGRPRLWCVVLALVALSFEHPLVLVALLATIVAAAAAARVGRPRAAGARDRAPVRAASSRSSTRSSSATA